MTLDRHLQALIDRECAKTDSHGILLRVQSGDGRVNFKGSAGDATPDIRWPIASITKMFTATLIVQLAAEGEVRLDQAVHGILPDVDLSGLHVMKGVDFGPTLTVRHLLHQTSGLADYYEGDLAGDLKMGRDRSYGLQDVLRMTRALPPQAVPGNGRSHYSDTNYQLLGAVIERVTGQSFDDALQSRICGPLGLSRTEVLSGTDYGLPVYHGDRLLQIPMILASMSADGGIVSTLDEMMIFLRAFMRNELFPRQAANQMRQWNRLFFPIRYGHGLMRIKLPLWTTLMRGTPELIGHSGASGSFAYYAPEPDIHLVGTFNQTDAPRRPIGFMYKILRLVADYGGRA
ncbi:serine hydrolase domain-containing protein [Jannaschia sp. 2305UL9-9]|uniref:serine hydrolase domain-containing protein n=1 Tax=Jannaschia sp. 2305UL9-9 TaxID=3121638 RepID=UPI003527211B